MNVSKLPPTLAKYHVKHLYDMKHQHGSQGWKGVSGQLCAMNQGWNCPRCLAENNMHRNSCRQCGIEKPDVSKSHFANTNFGPNHNRPQIQQKEIDTAMQYGRQLPYRPDLHQSTAPWMNKDVYPGNAGGESTVKTEQKEEPPQMYSHHWDCDCGASNEGNALFCNNCRQHPPTWNCVCYRINPGNRSYCGACRRQRGAKPPETIDMNGLPMITPGGRRRYNIVRFTQLASNINPKIVRGRVSRTR